MKVINLGGKYRFGVELLMENRRLQVHAEHLQLILAFIRKNAHKIESFEGNAFSVDIRYRESAINYFKTFAVAYYCGIPYSKFHYKKNRGWSKDKITCLKLPEACY